MEIHVTRTEKLPRPIVEWPQLQRSLGIFQSLAILMELKSGPGAVQIGPRIGGPVRDRLSHELLGADEIRARSLQQVDHFFDLQVVFCQPPLSFALQSTTG